MVAAVRPIRSDGRVWRQWLEHLHQNRMDEEEEEGSVLEERLCFGCCLLDLLSRPEILLLMDPVPHSIDRVGRFFVEK